MLNSNWIVQNNITFELTMKSSSKPVVCTLVFFFLILTVTGETKMKLELSEGSAPKSSLFASCLATAGQVEATLFSLEVAGAEHEFVRHVPAASGGVHFQPLVTNAALKSIFDCASAAYTSGYKMFRFYGPGNCTVSRYVYDLSAAPTCSEEEIDAVFVLSSANALLPCEPPRIYAGTQPDGVTTNCIFIGTAIAGNILGSFFECLLNTMSVFHPLPGTSVADVAAILTGLGKTEQFRVGMEYPRYSAWMWTKDTPLKATETVPGLDISSDQGGSVDIMFLDPAQGFLVNFGNSSNSFVTLCI